MSVLEFFQQPFPPLAVDTVESILGRMIADATAGIDPTDPAYPDLIGGSIGNDLLVTTAIEMDRLRDFASNEVPRAGVPTLAQGPYLDAWAEALGLERKDESPATGTIRFTGDAGTIIDTGTEISTESASPDTDPEVFATTAGGVIDDSLGGSPAQGVLNLPILAETPGQASDVLANTITLLQSPTDGVASVTNPLPTAGGADVESDDRLQRRIGLALAGSEGSGTISDYERWFLQELAVGFVTVQPTWAGPTTVRVQLTDVNNNPFTDPTFIANLQAKWDPTPGQGHGLAPIGHFLTVATPGSVGVTLSTIIAFHDGFSYDGTGGTRAIRSDIMAALQAYFAGLKAGDTVVLYSIVAAIMDVVGVANLSGLTLAYTTALEASAGSTDTALTVLNSYGFAAGQVITVGGSHVDTKTLSGDPPDATHLNLTAAVGHTHIEGDPVTGPALTSDLPIDPDDVAALMVVSLS